MPTDRIMGPVKRANVQCAYRQRCETISGQVAELAWNRRKDLDTVKQRAWEPKGKAMEGVKNLERQPR